MCGCATNTAPPKLGAEAGSYGTYDAADRWRYAVRIGVRGDLADDDFYYGLRLETSPNERSTWNTFGSGGTSPYNGPFSKSSDSVYVGVGVFGMAPGFVAGCLHRQGAAAALHDANGLGFGLHSGRGWWRK